MPELRRVLDSRIVNLKNEFRKVTYTKIRQILKIVNLKNRFRKVTYTKTGPDARNSVRPTEFFIGN